MSTSAFPHPVIGVVGGCGGVGASTFAAVLAAVCGAPLPLRRERPRRRRIDVTAPVASALVDLDVSGGGIDVLLGIEDEPGARWSGLRVAGGRLEPATLVGGLPRAGPVAVLAADTITLDPDAVSQVLDVAAALGPVVVDLSRGDSGARAAALLRCALLIVVVRADVTGLVGAHSVVAGLPALPRAAVVRRAEIAPRRAAELVGLSCVAALPRRRGQRIDVSRPPRGLARVAGDVLALARPGAVAVAEDIGSLGGSR